MARSPVAKRLKEARLLSNLSQKKLGIAAGFDKFSTSPRMNNYERSRHEPDFSTLKAIAKVLRLPVAYFYAESSNLAAMIKLFHLLTEEQQREIIKKLEEATLRREK
jgi:transcriptional regulator with XRE-family HTH domain